jgi:hypothetical protein
VRNCGDWQILFSGGRGKGDSGSNVLGFQAGKIGENLFSGISGCEACEDRSQGNAGSFEDRFTAAHTRVAHDLLVVFFRISGHEIGTFSADYIICSGD